MLTIGSVTSLTIDSLSLILEMIMTVFSLVVSVTSLNLMSSVCSKFNDFDIRSRNLLESLINRGFSKNRLKNSF